VYKKKKIKCSKIHIIPIIILLVLSFNVFINYLKLDVVYDFNSDEIETIFYIQENIPKNSKILVPDLKERNYIYELLIEYEYEYWDNSNKYFYDIIKGYLKSMNLKFIVINISIIEPKQLDHFKNDENFEILFENGYNIIFKLKI